VTDVQSFINKSPENRRMFREEELILEVGEAIYEALRDEDLSRSDLAARMRQTEAYLDRLLDGTKDMKIRTLAEIADVLGYRVRVSFQRVLP
jgi:ribosome-binding protein aMBF1 (putative translation factor)